jgi:homoserine O-acetyltransferase
LLKQNNHRNLVGIELDEEKILAGLRHGLDVAQADLNADLRAFADQKFDCAVLSQTLQAVHDVEGIIADMLRVVRTCIVSFPDFACFKLRRLLTEEGRAPKSSGLLHCERHNTPNIRFFSISGFDDSCRRRQIAVPRRIALDTEAGAEASRDLKRNSDLANFVICRAGAASESSPWTARGALLWTGVRSCRKNTFAPVLKRLRLSHKS